MYTLLLPLCAVLAAAVPEAVALRGGAWPPVHDFVISVAANASSDERYAAAMIADELGKQTCGADIPVVEPQAASHRHPTIAVGSLAVAALAHSEGLPGPILPAKSAEILGDEGYVLVGGGPHRWVGLSGAVGSPRGTGYAAVEFLEALGLRFLAWDCTTRPPCPASLPPLNTTKRPPQFSHRSIYLWPFPGHIQRSNHFAMASHNNPAQITGGQGSALPPWSEFSGTRPEWFWPRPVRGKPAPTFWQVCWTEPQS